MKFMAFKEFRGFLDSTAKDVIEYLSKDLRKILRELQIGLTRLKFTDNFDAFKVEVTIPAGEELAIRNELRSGEIPTEKIILRGKSGAESVTDGDTEWTRNFVYLKNQGASDATVTVVFLR